MLVEQVNHKTYFDKYFVVARRIGGLEAQLETYRYIPL